METETGVNLRKMNVKIKSEERKKENEALMKLEHFSRLVFLSS